jgi:GABA(A) receptor-associated protein
MNPFRDNLEQRLLESSRIRKKYPHRIPVIIKKDPASTLPDIDKVKYLVPDDITVGQFILTLKTRLPITKYESIFLYIGETILSNSTLLSFLYETHKEQDNLLYIRYTNEKTFG